MRVLFVLPHPIVPPNRGNKHHTLNLLRYAVQYHDIDVVGFNEQEGLGQETPWRALEILLPRLRVLRTFEKNAGWRLQFQRMQALAALRPHVLARYRNAELARFLSSEEIRRYDVVCFDMFMVAEHQRSCPPVAKVLLATDAYSLMMERASRVAPRPLRNLRLWVEELLQKRFERTTYPAFDLVACVSPVDAEWLRRLQPASHVEVLPIPVEDSVARASPRVHGEDPRQRVMCWASVNSDAVAEGVLDFIREGWPRIRHALPAAELVVWGKCPHPLLRPALKHSGIRHVSYVEDWVATLRESTVFVYPQRCGTGMQTKLQSAMALAIPSIVSPEAAGGLPVRHGKSGFICETPAQFAECCIALIRDEHLQARIGTAARSELLANYSSAVLGERMISLFKEAVSRRHARNNAT